MGERAKPDGLSCSPPGCDLLCMSTPANTRHLWPQNPLLYADLFEYIGSDHRSDWDNTEPGGWQEPQESPAHTSFKACHMACHEHPKCLSYTYGSLGHCVFTETMRLGGKKLSSDEQFSAGWDMEKFENWRGAHYCENPQWVKPSITRIYWFVLLAFEIGFWYVLNIALFDSFWFAMIGALCVYIYIYNSTIYNCNIIAKLQAVAGPDLHFVRW